MVSSCANLHNSRLFVSIFQHIDAWIVLIWNLFHLMGHLNKFGHIWAVLISTAKFSISSTSPRVKLIVFGQRHSVKSARAHLLHNLSLQCFDYLRLLLLFVGSVPTLPSIVVIAAAAPSVQHSVSIKSDRMEIAAINLRNYSTLINQRLNKTRFIFGPTIHNFGRFLVQSSTPGIHFAWLCQTHRVIVSTGNSLCPFWNANLVELRQVDNSLTLQAQFTMQWTSTHVNISRFWNQGSMLVASADILRWLGLFEYSGYRSWQKRVFLRPNAQLSVFVFAKRPHEGLLVNDFLRNYPHIFLFGIFFCLPFKSLTIETFLVVSSRRLWVIHLIYTSLWLERELGIGVQMVGRHLERKVAARLLLLLLKPVLSFSVAPLLAMSIVMLIHFWILDGFSGVWSVLLLGRWHWFSAQFFHLPNNWLPWLCLSIIIPSPFSLSFRLMNSILFIHVLIRCCPSSILLNHLRLLIWPVRTTLLPTVGVSLLSRISKLIICSQTILVQSCLRIVVSFRCICLAQSIGLLTLRV